jgi:beta-phosphoglucomutase-like phosphatase (HAD superfamily)
MVMTKKEVEKAIEDLLSKFGRNIPDDEEYLEALEEAAERIDNEITAKKEEIENAREDEEDDEDEETEEEDE